MPHVSRSALRRAAALGVAAAVCSPIVVVPAGAQESSGEVAARGERAENPEGPAELTSTFFARSDVSVQVMGDVLGPYSRNVGLDVGDLGTMAPLGDGSTGEFAMVFGDSFTGPGFGGGEWLSPVGVVATKDADGFIDIQRPLNRGNRVRQMVSYQHTDGLTLLPSDIINIDGTLYMQAMWNQGLHSVKSTQVFRSEDDGQTWRKASGNHYSRYGGMDELISWEMGPNGDYVYAVSTKFDRANPVYLWRTAPENIADQSKWELYDASRSQWVENGQRGAAVLDRNRNRTPLKAGELNLRYIDGYWVLVMFNESTLSVEVRISDTLERDWNRVPVVAIANHGSWNRPQTPANWSQPYGGYIVPGSHINDMDIVISQWNTATNNRYMATQFKVKGLERAFGTGGESVEVTPVGQKPEKHARPASPGNGTSPGTDSSALGSSDSFAAVTIALGVIAGVAGLAAVSWPVLRPLLPPQVQAALPF